MLVLGPSGSGKSTLTLCLDGLIPHLVEGDYAGDVTVAGLVVKDTPVSVLAGRTGLVFQDPAGRDRAGHLYGAGRGSSVRAAGAAAGRAFGR